MKHAIFQYYLSYNGVGKPGHWFNDKEAPEWAQYSISYFREYARMHDVDYYFSTERTVEMDPPENHFEHMRVCYDELFEQYDKVLYVDVDVVPKNMNANIFDLDVVDVAGWPEWKHPDLAVSPNWKNTGPLNRRFADFGARMVKPKTGNCNIRIINSGVILWSAQGRIKARQFDTPDKWYCHNNPVLDRTLTNKEVGHSSMCLDQPYMNAMWNKFNFNVMELPIEWNRMPTTDENRPCNFAHYVGQYRLDIPTIFEDIR
jgi:hypothetical protein